MRRTMIAVVVASMLAGVAVAGEADVVQKLGKALKGVATYEYGKDSGALRQAEDLVVEAAKDPELRARAEAQLLDGLKAAKTNDAKAFLCRQLRTIGSDRAVPALAAMLTDAKLSHMARYALGRIEGDVATKALRDALDKTSGKIQAGVIGTLANRRDAAALPVLGKLLGSQDVMVAGAAAGAIGRIGGTDAASMLMSARSKAKGQVLERVNDGLLACADQLLQDRKKAEAGKIYELFFAPKEPKHLRTAALRGLVAARGAGAAPLLVEAIKGDDPQLRSSAIGFVQSVKGAEATQAFAALLPSLAPEGQELLVRSLAARGDVSARPAVLAATKSQEESVRVAALEGLGMLGDASCVGILAEAASKGGAPQGAARRALALLRGDDVNRAIVAGIGKGDAKVRVELIRALAARRCTTSVPQVLAVARDDDSSVRREAIRALGVLAGEADLPDLLKLAIKPKEARDRTSVEQAIAGCFRRIEDAEKQAAPVLAAYGPAPADAKPTLLRLLGRTATAKALDAVRAATKAADGGVQDAAIRAMGQWPNPAPAEDLLTIARTSENRVHKVLALRGYVRVAALTQNATKMYVRAMDLAERTEDKKLVLGGLATAETAEALALAEKYLADAALQAEAGLAAVQIAGRIRVRDESRAKAVLQKVKAIVKDANVQKQAQDVLNEMEKHKGYIRLWVGAGPYSQKGKDGRAIFDFAFPPEKPDAKDVKWKRLTSGVGDWDINLESTFGGHDQCAAYVRTRVWSAEAQPARLEMGSDDGVKAWLNGKVVHSNNVNRGCSPAQDVVPVKLEKGWNDVLLKIVDNTGGWGFCCRVRKPDGSALDGLKYEAK